MLMMIFGLLSTKIGSCPLHETPSLVREENNNKIIIR